MGDAGSVEELGVGTGRVGEGRASGAAGIRCSNRIDWLWPVVHCCVISNNCDGSDVGCCVMMAISGKLSEVSWITLLAGNDGSSACSTSRLKHWAWAALVTVAPTQAHWQEDEAPTPTKLPVTRAISVPRCCDSSHVHTIYVFDTITDNTESTITISKLGIIHARTYSDDSSHQLITP